MIIVKDKERKTQLMIPRSADITGVDSVAEYITEQQLLKYGYATVDYVDNLIETSFGEINKTLEEIIG